MISLHEWVSIVEVNEVEEMATKPSIDVRTAMCLDFFTAHE